MSSFSQNCIRVESEYTFSVNDTFDSFDKFMERLSLLNREEYVHYWRRDSRTVENAFTKTSRVLDKKIKYYYVRYACVFGGHKYRSRGQGIRPTRKLTRQTDCPAFIALKATKCGTKLIVVDVCNDHNHEISQEAAEQLPHNRRPSKELLDEIYVMLENKVDKKLIIEYASLRGNKKITLKDLFNLSNKETPPGDRDNTNTKIIQRISDNISDETLRIKINDKLKRNEPLEDQNWNIKIECILNSSNDCMEVVEGGTTFEQFEKIADSDDSIIETNFETCVNTLDYEEILSNDIVVVDDQYVEFIPEETDVLVDHENYKPIVLSENISDPGSNQDVLYPVTFQGDIFVLSNELLTTTTAPVSDGDIIFEDLIKIEPPMRQKMSREQLAATCSRRSRRIIMNCRKCGSNARLIRLQLSYMQKKKDKLKVQIGLLKAKKRKLRLEINKNHCNNF